MTWSCGENLTSLKNSNEEEEEEEEVHAHAMTHLSPDISSISVLCDLVNTTTHS
jgi:hypothetical protein